MADIAAVVDSSAVCNVHQIVHTEDTQIVPTHDWPSSFLLPHFKKISNIKKYHHFHFSSSTPGTVSTQTHQRYSATMHEFPIMGNTL